MRGAERRATREPIHLIGNVNLDLILGPLAAWPRMGTETFLRDSEVRVGGAGGNAALASRALGVPVRLHASVGDDLFGDVLMRELGGLAGTLQRVRSDTAYSVALAHPGGERTFFTTVGHLGTLDVAAVERAVATAPASIVLLTGYFLLPPFRTPATRRLLAAAKAAGHTTLLDPGWPSEGFVPDVRDELATLLPFVDVVLPNELEALAWTGHDRVDEAAAAFARRGVRAVVKRGAAGASWLEGDRLRSRRAPGVEVADTVGAGDAFDAALVAALHEGRPLSDAVRRATSYASGVVASRPRSYEPRQTHDDRVQRGRRRR